MPILRPEERVGTVIAEKYLIEGVLGRGGMGVVFTGKHLWTDRQVAVKVLAPELSEDEMIVQRFLGEAKAAARLKHPNVVDVLDMGAAEDGAVYLVLELLDGETLDALLERSTTLDAQRALEVTIPILDALAHAHDKGIVHRDIKPDNVFLSVDARGRTVPKLLDFGIAKIRDAGGRGTATGTVIGTPCYMSPEQALAETEVGTATDVWSMGVVLYEALSGSLPFQAETTMGTLAAILTTTPKKLMERAPGVPEAIAAVIDRALARDPMERYHDARAFSIALLESAAREGIEPGGIDEVIEGIRAFGPTAERVLPPPREHEAEAMHTVDVRIGEEPVIAKLDAVVRTQTPVSVERAPRARWPIAIALLLGLAVVGGAIVYSVRDPEPAPRAGDVELAPIEEPAPAALPEPPGLEVPPPAMEAEEIAPSLERAPAPVREARPRARTEPAPRAPRALEQAAPEQPAPERGANNALILE